MNKLFIVLLLAVCLISVNAAVVKRETETPNYLSDVAKQVENLFKDMQRQVGGALNPEEIKKAFNTGVDNINKLFEAGKQGEAKQ